VQLSNNLTIKTLNKQNLYGLVLCGGKSSRMGEDKCFINYHGKPQYYYVYEMLQQFCAETIISCNAEQSPLIDKKFKTLEDLEVYADRGPATGVLTAFSAFPQKDLLVIACDYPLLSETELRNFLQSIPPNSMAASFYNDHEQCYQPVLAWYSSASGAELLKSAEDIQLSLKQLLQYVDAYKHTPIDAASMLSADTQKVREKVMKLTNYDQ
jgi:molybdenum cofactor guanylyltransferase